MTKIGDALKKWFGTTEKHHRASEPHPPKQGEEAPTDKKVEEIRKKELPPQDPHA